MARALGRGDQLARARPGRIGRAQMHGRTHGGLGTGVLRLQCYTCIMINDKSLVGWERVEDHHRYGGPRRTVGLLWGCPWVGRVGLGRVRGVRGVRVGGGVLVTAGPCPPADLQGVVIIADLVVWKVFSIVPYNP